MIRAIKIVISAEKGARHVLSIKKDDTTPHQAFFFMRHGVYNLNHELANASSLAILFVLGSDCLSFLLVAEIAGGETVQKGFELKQPYL